MKLFRNILSRVKKPERRKETTKASRINKVNEAAPLIFSGTKQCRKCQQIKTFDLFYYAKTSKDGRQSYCKVCCAKVARAEKIKKKQLSKRAADRAAGISKIITVKLIPAHLYNSIRDICHRRGCTQQDLFVDMIKTYLILHEKNEGA